MTKCIVLGESSPEKKELEPIRLSKFLDCNHEWNKSGTKSSTYDNVELICRNYGDGEYDLIFTYYKFRHEGFLYLGHWNDGVV